jgi:hypothetical protein
MCQKSEASIHDSISRFFVLRAQALTKKTGLFFWNGRLILKKKN